jgi:hypothetical protein
MIVNDQTMRLDRDHTYSSTDKRPPIVRWRSAPFAGDTNVTRKRWRRPRLTIRSASAHQAIQFGYLRNYSEAEVGTLRERDLNFLSQIDFDAGSGLWVIDAWTDLFAAEDTARWNGWSATVHVVANALNLDVTTVSGNKVLTTDVAYDFRTARVEVNAAQMVANTTTSFLVFNGNTNLRFTSTTSTVTISWRNEAAATTVLGTFAYGAAKDWWAIECDGSVIYWQSSPDGVTWTTEQSIAIPSDITMAMLAAMTVELRCEQTSLGTGTAIFDTFRFEPSTDSNFFVWDTSIWAVDLNGNEPPDNFVAFETLPSAGAGNVFQMEFRSVDPPASGVDVDSTNAPWGIDSIVLPFREKGVR